MTDENQEPEVPDFDDPSYAELRGLLADASAPSPMPADVAARLDATLADLVAARTDEVVVPLRRRRPIGQRLLVAAAAVVLVGAGAVGVAQVLDNTQQNDSLSAATADRDSLAEAPAVPPTALEGASGGTTDLGAATKRSLMQRLTTTSFTAADFPRQVTELVGVADRASTSDQVRNYDGSADDPAVPVSPEPQYSTPDDGTPELAPTSDPVQEELSNLDTSAKAAPPCVGPATLPERAVALRITFDDRPAALVLHPVVNGSRYVAAWSCDGHQLLAFTTLAP